MTLLQLRDRCNELLSGTSMPHYETGIENLRQCPGTMTLDWDNPLDDRLLELQDENKEFQNKVSQLEHEALHASKLIKRLSTP